MSRRYYTVILMIAVCVAALGFLWVGKRMNPSGQVVAGVTVPPLAGAEVNGRALFNQFCASCHGDVAQGTDQGPPLIHDYYKPSHHGDEAFFAAALLGVRQHHWQFGNMPKVEGVTEQQVGDIVAFVRRVQAANGIN